MSHLFCKNYTLPITAMIFFGIENIQQLFISLQKCCVIRNKKRLCISLKPWSESRRNTIRKKKKKKAVTRVPPFICTVLWVTGWHRIRWERSSHYVSTCDLYSPAGHKQAWCTKAQEPPWAISVRNSILHNLKTQMHKPRFWEVRHPLAAE